MNSGATDSEHDHQGGAAFQRLPTAADPARRSDRYVLLPSSGDARQPVVFSQGRAPSPRDSAVYPYERQTLLSSGPVKLTPSWEEKNLTSDQLNFKHLNLEEEFFESKPPRDRYNIVYLILLIHGIGTLMPWNMFITAKLYFTEYKLQPIEGMDDSSEYRKNFISYLGLAAQLPNVVFNCLNLFVQFGGNLTTRIVVSLFIEVIIFIGTVVLAMVDSSQWQEIFFWVTMSSVVVLNMANGVYQNSVYGLSAKLPMRYTNAVVLGSNISGTLTSIINIAAIAASPNQRTAAIYYFITALFFLLACFDTYFALPILRFYRYYDRQAEKQRKASVSSARNSRTPFWHIFKKTSPQLFNVFMTFFVTLSVFPAVQSDIKKTDPDFIINDKYYIAVMCFLCFNGTAMLGNLIPFLFKRPGPRWLWLPVLLRTLLIPAFLLCNYQPDKRERILPVLINNDWAYLSLGVTLGLTSGYFSSLSMMYAPRCVEPQYAGTAAMMAAAFLIIGIFAGINFSLVLPWIVENLPI